MRADRVGEARRAADAMNKKIDILVGINYFWYKGALIVATKLFDQAKKNKADEFYTRLVDIEAEMRHYWEHFRGKVIFCNCDDPYESDFFKYFAMNFNSLGLKKLIATCYMGSPISNTQLSLFDHESENDKTTKSPHKIEITEVRDENGDGAVDLADVEYLLKNRKNALVRLDGDGDFRSPECIKLLDEADVVVTNPPFSLFREYIALLMEHKKTFIVIGNTNALTYKETFKQIKENALRTGYTNFNVGMYFFVPDYWEDFHKVENGRKLVRVSTSCWFTNLDVKRHKEYMTLYKRYSPIEYPHYDNYDAIEVSKVAEIPLGWEGAMGVPITFLDKYNPDQFEVIALGIVGSIEFSCEKKMEILKDGQPTGKYTVNAKGTLYRKYNPSIDTKPPAFKNAETGELYSSIYARVIIKRKGVDNEHCASRNSHSRNSGKLHRQCGRGCNRLQWNAEHSPRRGAKAGKQALKTAKCSAWNATVEKAAFEPLIVSES
jgi:hypothetical protein